MAEAIKGDEYLTVSETAEMLDCLVRAISHALDRNNLAKTSCSQHQLSELKQAGVLPMKTPQAMLLTADAPLLRTTVRNTMERDNLVRDICPEHHREQQSCCAQLRRTSVVHLKAATRN